MHRYVLMLLFLMSLAVGMAQHLEVQSPPDRFVAPGEFVTMVFRLEASPSRVRRTSLGPKPRLPQLVRPVQEISMGASP